MEHGSADDGPGIDDGPGSIESRDGDEARNASRSRLSGTTARYTRTRRRFDTSAAGHVQRRITELELMNQALILAALGLMVFIPALISLAAVSPIGNDGGIAADWGRRLGLSPQASHDFRALFAARKTTAGATTPVSTVITILFAVAWPATLQHGYEIMWGLPSRGRRDLWRPVVWLVTFLGLIAGAAATGSIAGGITGTAVTGFVGFPLLFAWAWWMQHFLLGGRVGWRPLLGGAVALAIALFGLSIFNTLVLSRSIVTHSHEYGPIGVVFVLLSWFIALGVVMLGGALVGAVLYQRRTTIGSATPPYPEASSAGPGREPADPTAGRTVT